MILIVALGIVVYNANHRSGNPTEIWLTIAFASAMFIASAIAYWIDDWRKRADAQTGPDDGFG